MRHWTYQLVYSDGLGLYEVHYRGDDVVAWGAHPLISFASMEDASFFFEHAPQVLHKPVLNSDELPDARREKITGAWVFRDVDGRMLFVVHLPQFKDVGPYVGMRFSASDMRAVESYAPVEAGEYEVVGAALVDGVWQVNISPVEGKEE